MDKQWHMTTLALRAGIFLICLLVPLVFCACADGASTSQSSQSNQAETVTDTDNALSDGASFSYPKTLTLPDTSGKDVIDVSHVNDGYVCAHEKSEARLKFQVTKGDATYNYDLPADGTVTVYPINMGDGEYLFRIMQNTEGSNYIEIDRAEADVKLSSEFAPYLIPNVFCDYDENSACVKKARELAAGAKDEAQALEAVCTYVVKNVSYDNDKAAELSTSTGYVPDPDETLAEGKGVCFDYASLGAAMLRTLGIPVKIVTGYVSPGDLYHAWIMVYADGEWKTGEFSVSRDTWSRVDLTFASTGSTEFTGDGASYTDRYVY